MQINISILRRNKPLRDCKPFFDRYAPNYKNQYHAKNAAIQAVIGGIIKNERIGNTTYQNRDGI